MERPVQIQVIDGVYVMEVTIEVTYVPNDHRSPVGQYF